MNFRLSPSKIEKYRQYVKEEYNGFITKEKLIDTIKGLDKWTAAASFGTAFHLVMENGAERYRNKGSGLYVIQDDKMPDAVVCHYSEIELADEFHNCYGGHMTWEVPYSETIQVDNHLVEINGRMDGILGREVHENKTTKRNVKVGFYQRSMQYKIYLMCMDVGSVQYNIFPYKEPAPKAPGEKRKVGSRDRREVSYFPCKFYHGGDPMIQEVHHWARGLISFCERHDLLNFIVNKSVV